MEPKRFWSKVDVRTTDECWVWMGYKRGDAGYGGFRVGKKIKQSHRVSYELVKGQIPDGLQIDHLCRNKSCVNPNHLEAVTPKINSQRATGKVVCLNGHLRDRVKKNGTCYQCELDRNALVRNAEPGKSKARGYLKTWREKNREHVNEQAKLRMRKVRAKYDS